MDNKETKEIILGMANDIAKELKTEKCRLLEERFWALDGAIEALGKQIPKKPRYVGEVPVCSCGMNLSKEEPQFCSYCGQKIDWSEDE